MKILVTGGAGFIGSHLVEHFQDKAEICVLDNFRTGNLKNLAGLQCEIVCGDILDCQAVEQVMRGVDWIFHLAAMSSVPESLHSPQECVAINVSGTLNILGAAVDQGVKKVILASSAAIYGNDPIVPKIETMLPAPESVYAVTKLDGEHYLRILGARQKLTVTSLRFFNVFGPRQNPDSNYAAAVPIFIRQALHNAPLTVFGDGEQTRDFIYVKDVVAGMVFAAKHATNSEIYNLGYGRGISINDLARLIVRVTGSRSGIEYHPQRAGDIRYSVAAVDKITALGFLPPHGFERGLSETVDFFGMAEL
jgi:UDP-glucose 4-epimerase